MAYTIPTFRQILSRVRADFGGFTDGTTPIESVEYVLAAIMARLSKGLYGFLSYILQQAFYDTADDTYFWHWLTVFGLTQKQAQPWEGTVTFTGTNGTNIPSGTLVQRTDGQLYETVGLVTIASGTATAVLVAQTASADANLEVSDVLQLGTPIVGVDADCTIASVTQTGADEETRAEAQARLLSHLQTPPSGGGPGDYVNWALEVAGVTRAWEFANLEGPNTVAVAFVRDGDGTGSAIIPDAGERTVVQDYLDTVAPITVTTSVITLTAVPLDITLSLLSPDTAAVRTAIEESVTDLLEREGQPSSTLTLSKINEAISGATGEEDHVMTIPAADITYATNEMPVLGTLTVL